MPMWIVFSLVAALSAGIFVTLSKAGIKNVDASLAFAIQSVLIFVVSWGVVVLKGNLSGIGQIEKRTWIYLITAGVITTLSSLFSFEALKLGDASRVSPLDKVSLVFAVIFAVIFLKERVNWQVITGGVLMIAGALFIAFAKKSS